MSVLPIAGAPTDASATDFPLPLKPTLNLNIDKYGGRGSAPSTPMSQATTAPSTPMSELNFDSFQMTRTVSGGASSACSHDYDFDDADDVELPMLERKSIDEMFAEVKGMYDEKTWKLNVIREASCEAFLEEENDNDEEIQWVKSTALSSEQASNGTGNQQTVDALLDSLNEVKTLFAAKFGQDVDDNVDENSSHGAAPSISALEQSLNEVKGLFEDKFGEDVDEVEADGIKFHVTRGGVPSMGALEQSLNEVKGLFEDKFGEEVDEVEADGIKFHVTRGGVPSMGALEQSLNEVKGLFKDKFGEDVDVDEVEADGIKFHVTRGGVPSMGALEQSLNEVKRLFEDNFGEDVDEVEADGIKFHVTRGAVPSMGALEQSLNEVKGLFEDNFGEDVDEVEADGIKFYVTRGAVPSMGALEQSLNEVKGLFDDKFGEDVDDDSTTYNDMDSDDEIGVQEGRALAATLKKEHKRRRVDPLLGGRAVTFDEMVQDHEKAGRPASNSYWQSLELATQQDLF